MASQIPATSWKDLASLEEQLRTSKKRPDVATVRKFLKGVRLWHRDSPLAEYPAEYRAELCACIF